MTLAELRDKLRVLVNDHATANKSIEPLTLHLENVVDGVNTMFHLMNNRVVETSIRAIENGIDLTVSYDADGNFVLITPAPSLLSPAKLLYYWQRVRDSEMDVILQTAINASNLTDVSQINSRSERVVLSFAKAYTYEFMANHAAEYYTVSAGGKTVSKDAVFSHYFQMYQSEHATAMRLRDDYYQIQGERNIPSAVATGTDVVDEDWIPYD